MKKKDVPIGRMFPKKDTLETAIDVAKKKLWSEPPAPMGRRIDPRREPDDDLPSTLPPPMRPTRHVERPMRSEPIVGDLVLAYSHRFPTTPRIGLVIDVAVLWGQALFLVQCGNEREIRCRGELDLFDRIEDR